jgi:hypothetical protein
MSYLLWSKTKKQLNELRCQSLKGRVDIHLTNYRNAHDQVGRAYITVDNKEILNMCTIISERSVYRKEAELVNQTNKDFSLEVQLKAMDIVMSEGVFAQYDFLNAVEEFLTLSIDKALKSNNMAILILALLDRRTGKRTLIKMKDSIKEELDIVQYFYHLRCEAENIKI